MYEEEWKDAVVEGLNGKTREEIRDIVRDIEGVDIFMDDPTLLEDVLGEHRNWESFLVNHHADKVIRILYPEAFKPKDPLYEDK